MKASEQAQDRIWDALTDAVINPRGSLEIALQAIGDMVPETPEEEKRKRDVMETGREILADLARDEDGPMRDGAWNSNDGADDSTYREEMRDAGRGHLLK